MNPPKCRCTARKNLEVEGSRDVRSPWICRSLIDAACWREPDQAAADIRPYREGGVVLNPLSERRSDCSEVNRRCEALRVIGRGLEAGPEIGPEFLSLQDQSQQVGVACENLLQGNIHPPCMGTK